MWINDYFFIAKISIPIDANMYVEKNKFKSDKLIIDINNKVKISKFYLWNDTEFCKISVKQNYHSLKYVNEQTEELCKLAFQ